jgi:hypothetical protein
MATFKPSNSTEIEDIQRRMAQIRHDMHSEVLGAVQGARALTDWRSLIRTYPWVTVGIAAAAGYFLVPRRRSDAPTFVAVKGSSPEVAALIDPQKQGDKAKRSGWSILGTVFSLVAPLAVRAAQNYAMQHIEGLIGQYDFPPKNPEADHSGPNNGPRSTTPLRSSGRLGDRL